MQSRGKRWRAIVRRTGHAPKSKTFPTKTAAKTCAGRIERGIAEREARGEKAVPGITIGRLVDWRSNELGGMKAIDKTRAGNMSRLREGPGSAAAQRLTANDLIEHARRRVEGRHAMANGQLIPACAPAAMNVELGYLSEWLKLAGPMHGLARAN